MSISDDHDADQHNGRLAQLESKLTFLEHTGEILAGAPEAQQSATQILNRTPEGLQEQLGSLQRDTGISDRPDEPPPHY